MVKLLKPHAVCPYRADQATDNGFSANGTHPAGCWENKTAIEPMDVGG